MEADINIMITKFGHTFAKCLITTDLQVKKIHFECCMGLLFLINIIALEENQVVPLETTFEIAKTLAYITEEYGKLKWAIKHFAGKSMIVTIQI